MANLIDSQEKLENLSPDELENITVEPVKEPVKATPKPEDEVPEKYRGKSAQELIRMHQEAEKAYGRTGSEVGELRKIVDTYITSQLVASTPQKEAVKEDDDVNIFTDPDKYLEKKLATHPDILAIKADRELAAKQQNLSVLEQKHPDFREVIQDAKFAEWVQGSKTRTRLFIEADRGYDADAADELLTTWKEKKALAAATVQADQGQRKEDLKRASTGGARGSETPPAKKVYRRADIINLSINDPQRYAQLADDILLAYKEKRVR